MTLLDAKAAARMLSLSPSTLYDLAARNAIPHVRLGRADD